jgi:hypothetical protein
MKTLRFLFAIIVVTGILSGCFINLDDENPRYGLLFGNVSIGPLYPVEPCNLSEDFIEEVYDARKIIIYKEDSSTVVRTLDIDDNHIYKTNLVPGHYIVDINHLGIDHSGDVPKAITISADEVIQLDIDIDTGIR